MSAQADEQQSAASLARSIHSREGIGISAHVLQGRRLQILRIRIECPVLVLVDRGIKAVKADGGAAVRAEAGQAIVLSGNQTVDFTNTVIGEREYEARWLLFDNGLLEDAYYRQRAAQADLPGRRPAAAQLLKDVANDLVRAFDAASHSLASNANVPDSIARQRMLEVMHWLLECGIELRSSPAEATVSVKIRALIAGRLDREWAADRIASELAMSTATLRRRLSLENITLTELLIDARMSTALTLLQATSSSISEVALSVGYESASRFAARFRNRFGFSPSAVRERDDTA